MTALFYIGEMHLNGRYTCRLNCITDRIAVVSEGAGIDDKAAVPFCWQTLNHVYDKTLVIRLTGAHAYPPLSRFGLEHLHDLPQRGASIHIGLTGTEKIEVGTVDKKYLFHSHVPASVGARGLL